MSYEPTVWKTGDVVTSTKLNKLEQGVAGGGSGGGLVVTGYDTNSGEGTLNKTWKEIYDAASQGKNVVLVDEQEIGGNTYKAVFPLDSVEIVIDDTPPTYSVKFNNQSIVRCASADDYPTSA